MNGNLIFNKKGQLTPIIIVAIIVVVGIGVYFSIGGSFIKNVDPEVEPVFNFVQNCLLESSQKAILEVSRYGGYFIPPKDSLENDIPYYLKEGMNIMPTKERVQLEIANGIDVEMFFCIKNFENFKDTKVVAEEIESLVVIEDKKVIVNTMYPLAISKGEETYQLQDFGVKVNSKLGLIYDSAAYLMEDQVENPSSLCVACANDVAETHNLKVSSINYGEKIIIMTLKDEEVKIDNQDLIFNYAISYGE